MKQGIELDRAYSYQFCSPSRSSLQSGRLPTHVNNKNIDMTAFNPKDPVSGFAGIPRNMTGMAEHLKKGGYSTHQVIAASSCFLHMCSRDCCVLPGLFRSCSHVCLPDWQMGCGSVGTDGSNHIRSLTLYPSW